MVIARVRKTPSMKLIEFVHRECCGNSVEKVILRKLEEHEGALGKAASMLLQPCNSDTKVQQYSASTLTYWVIRLRIQREVGLVRRMFGRAENLDTSEVSDPTSELTASGNLRVKESISGPCNRCDAVYDLLEDQTLLSVEEEKGEMVLVINAKSDGEMKKHWFPVNRQKIEEYVKDDGEERE